MESKPATAFGPLNAVRTALVAAAIVTALLAMVLGYWIVSVVLLAGVLVHAAGWLWLYRRFQQEQRQP